ncbi:MAG: baseplate J/gp47 family protein [Porphyromonadaceae bacterium]|nr:baseplate J/gp47 family protein [Porphyromonadaceae bacterium]
MNHLIDKKGIYRHERFARELIEGYFNIDNRTDEQILEQTAALASAIRYYNEQNNVDGNWEAFFEDIYNFATKQIDHKAIAEKSQNASMPPHLALYFAFIHVFNIAKDELNRFTRRHLDYYYNNILKFAHKQEIADKVHLFLELNKKEKKATIAKGTLFDGGIDSKGKKRLYASDFDATVNKSTIIKIKTLTTQKNGNTFTFTKLDECHVTDIGIAIASPMFYLKDGKRTITLTFTEAYKPYLKSIKQIEYTTSTDWQRVETNNIEVKEKDGYQFIIMLDYGLPPMVGYNEAVHNLQLKTNNPIIRLLFSEGFSGEKDKEYKVENDVNEDNKTPIKTIVVDVEGSKDILLYNDYGKINGELPFMPYGGIPVVDKSQFIVGNNKIFNKFLERVSFNIDWKGMPSNLEIYYETYKDAFEQLTEQQKELYQSFDIYGFDKISDVNFFGKCTILSLGKWDDKAIEINNNEIQIKKDGLRTINEEDTEYSHQTKSGFIKFVVSTDFGHSIYSTLLSNAMMHNAFMEQKKILNMSAGKPTTDIKLLSIPQKPYTPEIQSLSINYKTTTEFNLNEHQLFSIHPFSNFEITERNSFYLPLFTPIDYPKRSKNSSESIFEKCFYITLSNIDSEGEVNIYFDICNPNTYDNKHTYSWHYFSEYRWIEMNNNRIIRDTTDGFNKSGIITFVVPQAAIDGEQVHLRLTAEATQTELLPEILNARTNCLTATFVDSDNNLSHLRQGLPQSTITKLVESKGKIKSIEQPYPSFGGKEAESDTDFYARISERLRHKNRASSTWDYERLVLEAFPQVAFALCLAHSNMSGDKVAFSPGDVLLLVSPDTSLLPQTKKLEPKLPTAMLNEIKGFFNHISSPHSNICVSNFRYKPIRVVCNVQLTKGLSDYSFYRDKLNTDLIRFISPWVDANISDYSNNMIYRSKNVADIYFFLENLEYIDYVVSCKIEGLYADGELEQTYTIADETILKESYEIFTSVDNHTITINDNGKQI